MDTTNTQTMDRSEMDPRARKRRTRRIALAFAAAILATGAVASLSLAAEGSLSEAAPATPGEIAPATQPVLLAQADPAPAAPAAPAPAAPAATAPVTPVAEDAARPGADILEGIGADGRITMLVGRSMVLKAKSPYKRVSITQPEVIGDNEIDPISILLTAKKAGTAQLIVWDEKDRSQVVNVTVDVDLQALDQQLKKMFPGAQIEVSASNGSIVLRGRVPNLQIAEQVVDLVAGHGKVLNFLELAGGQQIMLQVRFAEVSRTASLNLGFNAFATDGTAQGGVLLGPGASPVGGVASGAEAIINPAVTVFGAGQMGGTAFEFFVQALRSNNLMRVLAEPNLIAISGQEASFLAGGEFPIPVPQASGGGTTITIEYKQFGVRLTFMPVVLGDGKIRLKVSPEVSDLDFTRAIRIEGFEIPALTKRNLTTTIELTDGQTFAVGGLLNNRVTTTRSGLPVLGDLPVLGALFRSVRYERNETELVVLVTPRLVEPMNPGQVPELPGENWRFPTESDLFWDRDMGGNGAAKTARTPATLTEAPAAKAEPYKFHGPYGFTPPQGEQQTASGRDE